MVPGERLGQTGPMANQRTAVEVDGYRVEVTNLDKVMYPATGLTKGEVIAYYQAVAPVLIPHARNRPVTRKRWVHGVGTPDKPGQVFFHKNVEAKHAPEFAELRALVHKDGTNLYPLVNNTATLVWLAQLAALELHTPQWRFDDDPEDRPHQPDRLVLDLDPGEGAGLAECVRVALLIKEILDGMGLVSVPVTSGSKGLHLYAAVSGLSSEATSEIAKQLAQLLEQQHPDLVVSAMRRDLRGGKVFIDWSQNNFNKTTVAPYSLRGRQHPTVAAPRAWDEIDSDLRQLEFDEVLERLASEGDLLAPLLPD